MQEYKRSPARSVQLSRKRNSPAVAVWTRAIYTRRLFKARTLRARRSLACMLWEEALLIEWMSAHTH